VFTYLFFFEYLRPYHRVHIPADLEEFHFPLLDYAFQSLRHGRFPQWDPTVYCGMSFVSNIQTALFYPPTWLMLLGRMNSERLSFQAVQDLMLAHVWLAFFLSYLWLRGKRLAELPCIFGSGVFAFSGYMCTQLEHMGLAAGYAWIPLGLWGIDEASEQRSLKPLWKLSCASALCFLAGYPPTWFVFMALATVYALAGPCRRKVAVGVAGAVMFSLALTAVQLLPTWAATGLREPELRYAGAREPVMLLAFTLPNYIDFSINAPPPANPFADYFYLGLPVLFAIPLLFRQRSFRALAPTTAIGVASVLMVTNPFNVIGYFIRQSSLLEDICRDRYFLAGVPIAFAALTAYALDDFLKQNSRPVARWLVRTILISIGAWILVDVERWLGPGFPSGWRGWFDPLIGFTLFAAGIYSVRSESKRSRAWSAAVLVLFVAVDYKVFGTSKRFDAAPGSGQPYSSTSYVAMDTDAYEQLLAHPTDRILVDQTGPLPARLRHIGLLTPQGWDPFLTIQFRKAIETYGRFRTDREFDVDPDNDEALRFFGVRYIITADSGPMHPKLVSNPRFRLIGSGRFFYQVFEYIPRVSPFVWDSPTGLDRDTDTHVNLREWTPERRSFTVRSSQGGRLTLSEQFYPGWTASLDGRSARLERSKIAFQAVDVPPGEHSVVFSFREEWLANGAEVSFMALLVLLWWARLDRLSRALRIDVL
jgi:hypothetical protein